MLGADRLDVSRKEDRNAASLWAWRSGVPANRLPEQAGLNRLAEEVAPALLGLTVVSTLGGHTTEGVIVETEAYVGPQDPASHAAARIGKTSRNASMFGPPGLAYVYLIYGVHWCLNVVTGEAGFPAAVLIRSLDPLVGTDTMLRRRSRAPLASGPGRLCQALGITGELDGHDLSRPPLRLGPGWAVDESRIQVSNRIGITRAADWPLRFHLEEHPAVSG